MERRRLADIVKINKIMLNQLFGDEPSPLHFRFQAAFGLGKVCKRRAQRNCTPYGCGRLGSLKRQFIQQKTPFGVASNGFQATFGLRGSLKSHLFQRVNERGQIALPLGGVVFGKIQRDVRGVFNMAAVALRRRQNG